MPLTGQFILQFSHGLSQLLNLESVAFTCGLQRVSVSSINRLNLVYLGPRMLTSIGVEKARQ